MHRCHGTTTDITLDATRAVTKMKATITQRFSLQELKLTPKAIVGSYSSGPGFQTP